MKARLLAIASTILSIAVSASIAGSAQAYLVAGWDFSQYFNDGLLSIDGATYQNTLSANYSDLDPTFGAGAESAAFGTLYFNGSFGSTSVSPTGNLTEEFLPTAGSLTSNLDAGGIADAFTVSVGRRPALLQPDGMVARDSVSVVRGRPEHGSRDGRQLVAQLRRQDLRRHLDGRDRLRHRRFQLRERGLGDPRRERAVVNLGTALGDRLRALELQPGRRGQPIIDNVAINVPNRHGSQFFAVASPADLRPRLVCQVRLSRPTVRQNALAMNRLSWRHQRWRLPGALRAEPSDGNGQAAFQASRGIRLRRRKKRENPFAGVLAVSTRGDRGVAAGRGQTAGAAGTSVC
jgi:hypothetical protein